MVRTPFALTLAAAALLAAGCASKAPKMAEADCVFPQTKEKAPPWVCRQGNVEGVAVWEIGSWQKTGAGVGFQQDQAALSGRTRLAQQMRSVVSSGLKQFMGTTGAGATETVDQVASSTAKSISNESLVGSKIMRTVYAPDGTVYVLVGIDEAAAKKIVAQAVQTSMNNDRAQWQQLKGAQAQADLSAEIYKLGTQGMR